MKNKKLIALLLAAGLAPAHAAQDLLQSYQQALAHDPQIAAAAAQRRADAELVTQARSLFLPQIGLQGEANRVRQDLKYGSGAPAFAPTFDGRFTEYSYGVGLTQPLFRAESFTIYGQAKILVDQADLRYALARQDLSLRLAEAYFRVLQAQDALQSYEAEQTAVAELLGRARRAYELGAATIADVNDAQARYDLTGARRLLAQNELRIAREALGRITGAPVGELARLADQFAPAPPAPADMAAWAAKAEQDNLQVRLALGGFELARDEISRQRAQRYPKVDLVARYGTSHQSDTNFNTDQDVTQGSVGVTLSMPLFSGGAISSQVREAIAEKDQAFEQVRGAKQAATLGAEQAYLGLEASLQQVRALEQALKSVALNEDSTRRGQELGLRTTLDLLNIQRERYGVERDLSAARYAYLLNYLRLQAAVGQAVEADPIQVVNQFLAAD